jgi:hypothetical protein
VNPEFRIFFLVTINVSVIMTFVLLFLWVEHRERVPGIGWWLLGTGLITVAYLSMATQDVLPPFVWIIFGNTTMTLGPSVLSLGFVAHEARPTARQVLWTFGPPLAILLEQTIFYVAFPSQTIRTIAFSGVFALVLILVLTRLTRSKVGRTVPGRAISVGIVIVTVAFLVRLTVNAMPQGQVSPGTLESAEWVNVLLWFLMMTIWSLGLIGFVISRLGTAPEP